MTYKRLSSKMLCMPLFSLWTSFLTTACALMKSLLTCVTAPCVTITMSSDMLLRSTEFFSYTSMIHLSLMPLQLIVSLRYHLLKFNIYCLKERHCVCALLAAFNRLWARLRLCCAILLKSPIRRKLEYFTVCPSWGGLTPTGCWFNSAFTQYIFTTC